MKKINFWEFKEELKFLKSKKIFNKLKKTLESGEIFFGKTLKKFEKNFLNFNKTRYGLSVKNGTDALILSLMCAGIKKGDEVITVSLTAIPTISSIVTVGAVPVFVDVNNQCLIDVDQIEKKISNKTKAIIPVHLYGQSCELNKILQIAKKYKLKVIEDCAQSFGAKYGNKFVGNYGDFGCFSFYPTKILGAYGNGGFITCKNKNDLQKLSQLKFYGLETSNRKHLKYKKYYSNFHGINSRLDNMQASILDLKLQFIKTWIKKRQYYARLYNKKILNKKKINKEHVYHLYVLRTQRRNKIINYLKTKNINVGIHYENPVHKMNPYKKYFHNKYDNLLNSEKISREVFSLPLHPFIKKNEVEKIIAEIKLFNNKNKNEILSTDKI